MRTEKSIFNRSRGGDNMKSSESVTAEGGERAEQERTLAPSLMAQTLHRQVEREN